MSKAKALLDLIESGNDLIYKRVHIRDKGRPTYVDSNNHGLNDGTVIGYLNNKMNPMGWSIHKTTPEEKKEFGANAVRVLSSKGNTGIAKINLKAGTWRVVDNDAYLNGKLKYDRAVPYASVHLDHEENAKHFENETGRNGDEQS